MSVLQTFTVKNIIFIQKGVVFVKKILPIMIALATVITPFTMINVSAEDTTISQIQVATVSANAGEDIEVAVDLSSNQGIVAISFTVSYDAENLELVSVEDCGLFVDASFTPGGDTGAIPYRIMWENGLATDNYTETGKMAVLHFHVLDTATSVLSEIAIDIEENNTFDVNMDDVYFEAVNGSIEIAGATVETTAAEEISTTTVEETTTEEILTTTIEESTTVEEVEEIITTEEISTTILEESATTEEIVTTEESTTATTKESTAIETTKATTTSTITTEDTTKYFASVNALCDMASKDYQQKHSVAPAKTTAVTNEDGTVSIQLFDAEGNLLDTYVIDPVTGIGTGSHDDEVNLPQTGNNSFNTAVTATTAVVLTLTGIFAVAKSGMIHKKKEKE